MNIEVNVDPKMMLAAIGRSLDELEKINDFLREYGIEYPLGVAGIRDMHSQLAGQKEEAENTVSFLRQFNEAQQTYIKELEDVVLAAERMGELLFVPGTGEDVAEEQVLIDRVNMAAAKAKDLQKHRLRREQGSKDEWSSRWT